MEAPGIDYQHLSELVADKLADNMTGAIAEHVSVHVAHALSSKIGTGPLRYPKDRSQRERCRLVQVSIIPHVNGLDGTYLTGPRT